MIDLRSCRVELVGRVEAVSFILPNEHLGTMGGSVLFFGLRAPSDRLLSLVGFGHGPHAGGTGTDAVLERGWTRPEAPRNSGSYLISRALRYGCRFLGWRIVKAFSDPRFDEEGILYRAVGFRPYSTTHRGGRYAVIVDGKTLSDRAIGRRFGTAAAARAAGAVIVRLPPRQGWIWRSHAQAPPVLADGMGKRVADEELRHVI